MIEYRVLVIDDVPEIVSLCTETLLADGFQVHGVYSSSEALKWLADHEVDLILTDIHMPGMDGLEMLRRLREHDPEVAVAIITGFGTMENAVRALQLGAQGFVLKPFTPDELIVVVRDALEKQNAQREATRLRSWLPLLAMNQILVTEANLGRLSELTVDLVAREGQADLVILLLIAPDADVLTVQAARGLSSETARQIRIPVGQSLVGQLAQPGARTSVLADGASVLLPSLIPLESALLVSLRVKGTPTGVLVIGKGPGRVSFRPHDVEFFTLLGGQVAIALENARLYEATRKRAEELAALDNVSRMLTSILDLKVAMRLVMQAIRSAFRAEEIVLFLTDERGNERDFSVGLNGPNQAHLPPHLIVGQHAARWVIRKQKAIVVSDVQQDPRLPSISGDQDTEFRSILCVPLRGREKIIGAIQILGQQEDLFDEADKTLLENIAAPVAIAIENTRLFDDLQTANQKLFTAKAFTERILENIPSGLMVVDPDERVLSFNHAAVVLTGYSEVEMVGHPASSLLRLPKGQSSVFSQSLSTGASSSHQEATLIHRDGSHIPVRIRSSAFRDDAGQIVGAVGIFTDIRLFQEMEEERRRLDRLALLGEIAAIVAHEIRNPIATVATGIPLLISKEPGPEQQQFVDMMLGEIRRVNRIIEDILLLARRPQLNLQPCDLVQIVEEALTRRQQAIRQQGVTVRRLAPQDVPSILGDGALLDQVVTNLIANALESMTETGGHLTVGISAHRASCAGRDPRFVQVAVSDTGVGIPPKVLKNIFEPLFTPKVRGTGLGLAIARRIVEEHGGIIQAHSQPGVATTFVIRLWEQGPQPCWQIRECSPEERKSCPAFQRNQGQRCWMMMEPGDPSWPDICRDCPVYQCHQALTNA